MKTLIFTLSLAVASVFSYAQFTTTGNPTTTMDNVGIGTSNPLTRLQVQGTGGVQGANNDVMTIVSEGAFTGGPTINTTVGLNFNMNQQPSGGSGAAGWTYGAIRAGEDTGMGAIQGSLRFLTQQYSGGSVLTERMRISSNGNVGIGTTSPSHKLQVHNGADDRIATFVGGASAMTTLALYVSDSGASVGTDSNTQLGFYANGTTAMTILPSLNVGIGTTSPDAKLAVNGTVHSKEVKVDLTGWPDYVFKPYYNLLPLSQVKVYIDQNQHLPDMPSEAEVAKNGINLGEMVKLQTKKIEELTLYLIKQNEQLMKQNEQLMKQNDQIAKQKNINKSLQKQINQLVMRR